MATTKQITQQRPELLMTVVFLTALYPLAALYLLLGWLGWQSIPPEWQRESLPLYALACMSGAVSSFALLRWKRWGVFGLIGTWAITAILNGIFPRPFNLNANIGALLLLIAFALEVRRAWQFLE